MKLRQKVALILEVSHASDRLGRTIDTLLVVLIITNVLAIILESVPQLNARYGPYFQVFEVISVIIFSVEYVLRVWSCVDRPNCDDRHPLTGRLRYMLTPAALIDLVAILPFYLSVFFSLDLRFLRVVRLLRVFKLTRYSPAIGVLLDVLQEEAKSFGAAFFILFLLLIMASSGIYLLERDVQPEAFGSIPAAMWWAMATLTTVGYGDVTPITAGGKVFGGLVTIIGMGMVALPAGILASGFADHLARRRQEYETVLSDVLSDGVITQDERGQLEQLRKDLSLEAEDSDALVQALARSGQHLQGQCPHCGKPWREKAVRRPAETG